MTNSNKKLLSILAAAVLALPMAVHAADLDAGDDGAPDAHGPRGGEARPGMAPDGGPDDRDGPPARGPGPRGADGPMGFGPGHDGPPFLRGVDLTEAQQDKVFAILHGQVPYLREQARAHEKAERALFALHGAAKFDDAAAVKLAQASAQAMANITLQHLRTEQKVLAVLTPEQRKQVDERHAGRKARAPRP